MRITMLTQRAVIFFFVILILVTVSVFVLSRTEEGKEASTGTVPVDDKVVGVGDISVEEKLQIEDWIQENDLNQYGDARDRVYIGGTPLFDETTGQSTDRYEYILQGYSDGPWKK